MRVPLPLDTRRAGPSFPALLLLFGPPRPPNAWVPGGGAPGTHGTEWKRLMYEKGYPTLFGDSLARRRVWAFGGVLRVGPEKSIETPFFFRAVSPAGGPRKVPPGWGGWDRVNRLKFVTPARCALFGF